MRVRKSSEKPEEAELLSAVRAATRQPRGRAEEGPKQKAPHPPPLLYSTLLYSIGGLGSRA